MTLVSGRRAIEFACQSKACAPPPVGSGGSKGGGGGGSATAYVSEKLGRSRAKGPDVNGEWHKSPDGLTVRGVVTTAGGRKFPVEWDEFDIGPASAKEIINQYGKLLDTYPEVEAIPLALGLDAAKSMFAKTFSDDPYHLNQLNGLHDRASGYVVNSTVTRAPLMMAFTQKADNRKVLLANPENWGEGATMLPNTQAREYIVSHEFGHVVQQQALSQWTPGQQDAAIVRLERQIGRAKGSGVVDIGSYGLSKPVELFAEAFAMQTHGLQNKDASYLRDVTDPYTGGAPVRQVEWTS